MKKLFFLFALLFVAADLTAQTADIPFKYEEITSPQFVRAVELAGGVAVIPMGIMEKHGPHLPLGTDLFEAREFASDAAGKEYAIVFPPYFVGQIFEAKHQPGTIAYSSELMWKMLEETCNELSRNGLKKIVLVNGHGGNNSFLQFFCQSQLMKQSDFIVVLFQSGPDPVRDKEINSLKKANLDGHAGEEETSMMYYIRPDLVNIDVISTESGLDQNRLGKLPYGYTGIWWYARFPNHFAGDVVRADKYLGELLVAREVAQLAELIKYLKNNTTIEELQQEFYRRGENPLKK